ncbi:MAG: hypothetical protein JXQ65_10910 [Candidatus Marinimicrobia bacterium]|nr:hypothetical protein [Candidatus Neomarinimicrobiota bacterium]
MIKSIFKSIILLQIMAIILSGQNRGNNLGFQGVAKVSDFSVRALGMGSAFISMNGSIDALAFNPAGLATVKDIQVSLGMSSISRQWTENQVYNANRYFFTLPFYLERLYIPDPVNNGRLDHEVFYEALSDSGYVVALPETGQEPFSDSAADWKKQLQGSGISNLSLALPVTVLDKNVVLGLSYNNCGDFFDFDKNETYLDPHPGYLEYHMPTLVENEADSTIVNWYDFTRQREGSRAEFQGAVAIDLTPVIKLGLSVSWFSGETDDRQSFNKVGYFNLIDQNQFKWSYDTLDIYTKGTSTFRGIHSEIGMQLIYDAFSFGLDLRLPMTIKREWDYNVIQTDSTGVLKNQQKGTDELSIPFSYALGVNFHPISNFIFSMDYDLRKYSEAEWKFADDDTTRRTWVDQNIIRFGIEFSPAKMLDFRLGYRSVPQIFIPDGAAEKDKGPENNSYTLGIGLNFGKFGTLNGAWEYGLLKYSDNYFSNTNYAKEVTTKISLGYIYKF